MTESMRKLTAAVGIVCSSVMNASGGASSTARYVVIFFCFASVCDARCYRNIHMSVCISVGLTRIPQTPRHIFPQAPATLMPREMLISMEMATVATCIQTQAQAQA